MMWSAAIGQNASYAAAHEYLLKRGVEPHLLPIAWNCKWWAKKALRQNRDHAHIIHLAGCPHEKRIELLDRPAADDGVALWC